MSTASISSRPPFSVEGTVDGDTLTIYDVSVLDSPVRVTLQVNGDEMTGVSQAGNKWQLRRRPQ